MITRRCFLHTSAMLSAASALPLSRMAWAETVATFQNPILGGDHPDASPVRVGDDFYLTHSSFDYAPGLIVYHSRDLLNWKPVSAGLRKYYGVVWAPYLCEHEGHFYIYFPVNGNIFVVHADRPEGPWSEPVDLGIRAIDPAHIAENGRRFLHMSGGRVAELNADGLSVKEKPKHDFDPWPVPADWRIECVCLEGPKVIEHNGWFYLNVAEGGTGGAATSHSVISARSRHATGPWEYSPYNPIAHTRSRAERWHSVGHGRLVDTAQGKWYMTVHSYEKDYGSLGRQLLLLPIEWTPDGWFRVPDGITPASAISVPVPGAAQLPFDDPTDDFTSSQLGLQWAFWHEYDTDRFSTGHGALVMKARGSKLSESNPLTTVVGGHSYTVEVDVETDPECESGLALFYDAQHAVGLVLTAKGVVVRMANGYQDRREERGNITRASLRVINDEQEVIFYYRIAGEQWHRAEAACDVSGLNHNTLGNFLDLRPALFCYGKGQATFKNFRYWPEVKAPA